MALKKLLVAFSTTRPVEVAGKTENRRVRFAAGKVVDLAEDELELLDRLTKKTGKLHYRSPISEGGSTVTASEPEVVDVPDFAGQDVPLDKKTVDQLKAYLTFYDVSFGDNDLKSDLLDTAKGHAASLTVDPDAGL